MTLQLTRQSWRTLALVAALLPGTALLASLAGCGDSGGGSGALDTGGTGPDAGGAPVAATGGGDTAGAAD